MLKANVAWSTEEDSKMAGKACAKKAVLDLVQTKVAFLYTSVQYNQEEVIEGAKTELGTAPIIGCTSSGGVITPDGFITSDHGFAGMMAMGDPELAVGVAGSPKEKTARETGRKVAIEAMQKVGTTFAPSYFYMIASPGEEEEYVKGIQDVIGDVPIFGGSCADDDVSGKWQIFTNDQVFSDGVAVAFFYTNKTIANCFSGKFHETVNSGVITKLIGKRTLVEIDGVPALKKYAEWTGKKTKDLMGMDLLAQSVTAPLGVKDRLGDLVAIRHPMGGNKDNSMNIGNNLAVNTAVIQMEASVDELINATAGLLKDVQKEVPDAAAYLLVHCGGRKLAIGDRIEEVAKKVKKQAGDVPYLMMFTFGEYGKVDHGVNTCGGLMLSDTAFGKE